LEFFLSLGRDLLLRAASPEEGGVLMTIRDPVFRVAYIAGGSKICVMAFILLAAKRSTAPTCLAQVPFRPATFSPVSDDGDNYYTEDHQTRGHQEQGNVLGRLASQIRVQERLRKDA
jgi:hypothetical protein